MPSLARAVSLLLPLLAGYLRLQDKAHSDIVSPVVAASQSCDCHCDIVVLENSWIALLVGLLVGALTGSGACKEITLRRTNSEGVKEEAVVSVQAIATPSSRHARA